MDEEEPTSAELAALERSRRAVIQSFQTPALAESEAPVVHAGEGLSQRGNTIWADRRNQNLQDNPLGGGLPPGVSMRTVTLYMNGVKKVMDVPGTAPRDP